MCPCAMKCGFSPVGLKCHSDFVVQTAPEGEQSVLPYATSQAEFKSFSSLHLPSIFIHRHKHGHPSKPPNHPRWIFPQGKITLSHSEVTFVRLLKKQTHLIRRNLEKKKKQNAQELLNIHKFWLETLMPQGQNDCVKSRELTRISYSKIHHQEQLQRGMGNFHRINTRFLWPGRAGGKWQRGEHSWRLFRLSNP